MGCLLSEPGWSFWDLGVLWVQALVWQLRFQRTLDGGFYDVSVGELASQPDVCWALKKALWAQALGSWLPETLLG